MLDIHLDPLGGISGDMFVAAILDLRPDLETGLRAALSLCPMIGEVECNVIDHHDGVLTGRRFIVRHAERGADHAHDHVHEGHDHSHDYHAGHEHQHGTDGHIHTHADHSPATDHHHEHVAWRDIRSALAESQLDGETIRHAIGIFERLAEAEAKVHGTQPDDVAFHEVGAWDSIADIVSAAWLITQLAAARWSVGPIPLGTGRVRTAHGLLPVPAPATVHLLRDFEVIDDGIGGERVTPTGAAILSYLCGDRKAVGRHGRRLVSSSHGFGSKRLQGVSNCLRVLAFERPDAAQSSGDRVAVLECEIDDQTGEDLAQAIDRLRGRADVYDVVQAPVFGKKGRMMTHLRVLAATDAKEEVAAAILDETTSIGVRMTTTERMTLKREAATVEHEGTVYAFKIVERPSGSTAKLEADMLTSIEGVGPRNALRRLLDGLLRQKRGELR
jgi:uncharacterized protein (TIGR00299 family) protein